MNEHTVFHWREFPLELIPGMACICRLQNEDLILLAANEGYQGLFEGEPASGSPLEGLAAFERRRLCRKLARMALEGKEFHYSRRALLPGGKHCWLSVTASVLDPSEESPIILAVVQDVTEYVLQQKQMEDADAALQQTRIALDRLFETLPLGIAQVQLDEQDHVRMLGANSPFYDLISYTKAEFQCSYGSDLTRLALDPEGLYARLLSGESGFSCSFRKRDAQLGGAILYVSQGLEDEQERFLILDPTEGPMAAGWGQKRIEYFRSLLSRFTAGGILIRRADTLETLHISPNLPVILGYSREEFLAILDSGYQNLMEPEDAARILAHKEKVQLPVQGYSMEYRIRKKDGTYLWVYDKTSLDQYMDGTPIYFSILLDDTQRKESERQLRSSEEEYRLAVEQSGKLLFRYTLADRRLNYTREAAELLGVPQVLENVPESAIALGTLAPESIEGYQAFYAEMRQGRENGQVIIRRKIGDGSYRWLLGRYTLVHAADGAAVSAVGTFEDITAQYEKDSMLEQLRRERELLSVVAAHSGRMVFKYDLQEHKVYLDEKTAAHFGMAQVRPVASEQDLRLDQVARESRAEYLSFYRAIMRGEASGKTLVRRMGADGKFSWYQADFTTVSDGHGKPGYAVISFADVSDRYEMELAYRQYQQDFDDMPPESYTYYAFNLTQDRCDQEQGHLMEHVRERSDGTLDGVVQCAVESFIAPGSEAEYRKFNSRTRLLRSYAEGRTSEDLEFLAVLNGQELWTRERVRLFQDPYSGDVRCVFSNINIDEEKRQLLSLRRRAERDGLTGLLNRATFCEQVERINREDGGAHHALLMLDLDAFKSVNDQFGHIQGDKLLSGLGDAVGAMLRPYDLLARLGGDEFLIYLTHIPNAALAMRRAEAICKMIKSRYGEKPGVTVSIGVGLFPEDGDTFEELYARADEGLYEAKNGGGNRYAHAGAAPAAVQPLGAIQPEEMRVFVRTFGYFDVFVDGEAISFSSAKAKELLAILVDRRGGILSSGEAVSLLWEDEPMNATTLSRFRKVAHRLKQTLDKAGIGDILLNRNDGRCVDVARFACDYYLYLDGAADSRSLFRGSYMSNYSWAEETLANLEAAKIQ